MLHTTVKSPGDTGTSELVIQTGTLWRLAGWLAFLNVVVLAGTGMVYGVLSNPEDLTSFLSNPSGILVLSQLNLTAENTLATWYSSMLLFNTAILSFFCYLHAIHDHAKTKLHAGWLVISIFFALLSLDELGSLHENAGQISLLDVMGTRTWESVLFLPLALLMVFMIIFAWKVVKWHTPAFWLMGAGTVLFLSVPVQEYIETTMWNTHDETWSRPVIFGLIEEGAELYATLCFFTAMILFLVSPDERIRTATLHVVFRYRQVKKFLLITIAGVVLMFLLTYYLQPLFHSDDGIAINWYPAALAMTVFMACLSLRTENRFYILLYSVLLSGYFGSNFYSLIYWKPIELLSWVVRIFLVVGLVFYIHSLTLSRRDPTWRIAHIVGGVLISSAFISDHPVVTLAAVLGLILILYHQLSPASTKSD